MVLALSSPLQVGIYHDNSLIKSYESDKKTDEGLALIFDEIMKEYELNTLYFLNGPGSFMSIKMSYVFLTTIALVKNCSILASDGFNFNENSPIKAVGKMFFIKEKDKINLIKRDDIKIKPFILPKILDTSKFSENIDPLYVLPPL